MQVYEQLKLFHFKDVILAFGYSLQEMTRSAGVPQRPTKPYLLLYSIRYVASEGRQNRNHAQFNHAAENLVLQVQLGGVPVGR